MSLADVVGVGVEGPVVGLAGSPSRRGAGRTAAARRNRVTDDSILEECWMGRLIGSVGWKS